MLPPCPRSEGDPDATQYSPFGSRHYITVVHSCESSLKPVVRQALHFAHSDGHIPCKAQKSSPPETINGESHGIESWTTY